MTRSQKLLRLSALMAVVALIVGVVSVASNHLSGIIFVFFFSFIALGFYFWSNVVEVDAAKKI